MKVSELTKILTCLQSHAPQGVGVFTIANETSIAPQSIRRYLRDHKDYFVQLPKEQLFQVNRFGPFKGDVEQMVEHYESAIQKKQSNFIWYVLIFLGAGVSLASSQF